MSIFSTMKALLGLMLSRCMGSSCFFLRDSIEISAILICPKAPININIINGTVLDFEQHNQTRIFELLQGLDLYGI